VEPREIFARNLASRRRDAGLSQEDLGFRSGVHRTEVSNLETAKQEPRLSTIIRLARGLGIPTTDLLTGVDDAELKPKRPRPRQGAAQ